MATKTGVRRPLAVTDNNGAWSGATAANIDPGPDMLHGGGAAGTTSAQGINQALRVTSLSAGPSNILRILEVRLMVRHRVDDGTGFRGTWQLDDGVTALGEFEQDVSITTSYADRAIVVPTHPNGDPWDVSNINDSALQIATNADLWLSPPDEYYIDSYWLEYDFEVIPVQSGSARDAVSRRQWAMREPARDLRREHLDLADAIELDLMDRVNVSHALGPHAAGAGWGAKPWQRRFMRLMDRVFQPGRRIVECRLRDDRPYLCLYRDTMWSPISSAAWADGVARFGKGLGRIFARSTPKWVRDPSGVIVQIEVDQEPLSDQGTLLEGARTNYVHNSGFRDGATDTFAGWSKVLGTGAVGEDTTDLWWDPDVVPRVVLIEHDGGNQNGIDQDAASADQILANSKITVTVAHKESATGAGVGPRVYLVRTDDGWFWNPDTGAWQSASDWTDLTPSTDWLRETVAQGIDVGGSDTGIRVLIRATGSAVYDMRAAHAQVEVGDFPSSPILTEDGAGFTRARDNLRLPTDPSQDRVTNGTFESDISGWTDESTGSSSISHETTAPLSGAGSLKVTGTAGAHGLGTQSIAVRSGGRYCLEVTLSEPDGEAGFRIRNSDTGNYLNAEGQWLSSFGGGVNRLFTAGPLNSPLSEVFEFEVEGAPVVGDDETTLVLECYVLANGSDGLYDDIALIDLGETKITMAQGTLAFEWVPGFDAADVSSGFHTLKVVVFDADNRQLVDYDAANEQLYFRRRIAGRNYDATVPCSPQLDTPVRIVTRWTGVEGELDLPIFTSSIFVDGAKGTDVATTDALIHGASVAKYHEFEADGSDELGGTALTEVNSPSYFAAVKGNGARLQKVTDRSDSPHFTLVAASAGDYDPGTGSFVCSVKVRFDSLDAVAGLYVKGALGSSDPGVRLAATASGAVQVVLRDGSNTFTFLSSIPVAADGTFYSIGLDVDRATDVATLWINGQHAGEMDISGCGSVSNAAADLYVGAHNTNTTLVLDGWLDQFVFLASRTWPQNDQRRFHAAPDGAETKAWIPDADPPGVLGAPVESASGTIYLGANKGGVNQTFGHLRLLESLPYVATDEECARLPRG